MSEALFETFFEAEEREALGLHLEHLLFLFWTTVICDTISLFSSQSPSFLKETSPTLKIDSHFSHKCRLGLYFYEV